MVSCAGRSSPVGTCPMAGLRTQRWWRESREDRSWASQATVPTRCTRWWDYAGPPYQRTGRASEPSRRSWLSSTKTWTLTSKHCEKWNYFVLLRLPLCLYCVQYYLCDIFHQTLLYWNYFSCYWPTWLLIKHLYIHRPTEENVNKEHIYFLSVNISRGCQSAPVCITELNYFQISNSQPI